MKKSKINPHIVNSNLIEITESDTQILLTVFNQIHQNRKEDEAYENKITVMTVLGFFILIMSILKKETSFPQHFLLFIILGIVVITGIVLWGLLTHSCRLRRHCRMIVRIEQALGLFDEGRYITPQQLHKFQNIPFEGSRIFHSEDINWGSSNIWTAVTPQLIMILASSILSCLCLIFIN